MYIFVILFTLMAFVLVGSFFGAFTSVDSKE